MAHNTNSDTRNTSTDKTDTNDNGTPDAAGLMSRIDQLGSYLQRLEPFGFSGTVLIAQGDQVLLERGYGHMDYERDIRMRDDAVQSLGSIAKQFTGMLIMRLVDQGKLSTDDTLDRYFDGIPQDKAKLTIHQLLTHTAGVPDGLGSDFDDISTDDYLRQFFAAPLQSEPGTQFAYSNLGFTLAAMIAEKVGGKPYVELLRDVWKELGITTASWFGDPMYNPENSVSYYVDGVRRGSVRDWPGSWDASKPYWHILGNGGVCISPRDMHTYMQALFGGKLLSEKSLKQMLTPNLNNYGYGFDIEDSPLGTMIHHNGGSDGGVAAVARYLADLDLTVLLASNGIVNGQGYAFLVENIMEDLMAGQEFELPPEVQPAGSVEAGTFDLEGGKIRIDPLGNGPLLLHLEGQALLNRVMGVDDAAAESYARMNEITRKFGELILERRWDEAFALSERKTGNERRVGMIEQFFEMITQRHGPITGIKVAGTVPMPPYKGSTLLAFVTENSAPGVPIIFQKDDEFLGFRPMVAHNVMTLMATTTASGIIAFSPQLGLQIGLNFEDGKVLLE